MTAATRNGAADEMSPGISTSSSRSRLGSLHRDARRATGHARARALEQALGVVSSRDRLHDGRASLRLDACEEHRRLHLSRSDGQLVVDRAKGGAVHDERRVALGRLDVRAHAPERLRDALHGTGRERVVADELEAALLRGEDPREQAHERPRVRAVDRRLGRTEAAQPHAADSQDVVTLVDDVHAERPHRRDRRLRVGRAAET